MSKSIRGDKVEQESIELSLDFEYMIQIGEMKYCFHCAELIRVEAIKCRCCGDSIGGNNS